MLLLQEMSELHLNWAHMQVYLLLCIAITEVMKAQLELNGSESGTSSLKTSVIVSSYKYAITDTGIASGKFYQSCLEDGDSELVAQITPIREDGVVGTSVRASARCVIG